MKKLKLDLDQVQVVSFTVESTQGNGGTVNGHSANTDLGCGGTGWQTQEGWSCRVCLPDASNNTCNTCQLC
ncbi:MAG TPA: hypothetical protein VFS20_33380 [Longimicrobium sp.]|nr:hypothetical protein [Longimicrobium sp.]